MLDVVEMAYAETDPSFFYYHCLTIFFRFSLASSQFVLVFNSSLFGYSSDSMAMFWDLFFPQI